MSKCEPVCKACGKQYAGEWEDHETRCEKLMGLRGLSKKGPSFFREMTDKELNLIERDQLGRHCMAGLGGTYYYSERIRKGFGRREFGNRGFEHWR